MNRAERERQAYDEGDVWETSYKWHARFPHVFSCPNSMYHERLFADLVREYAAGRRVLEIGCGDGENAAKVLSLGAESVYGVDVSEKALARAADRAVPGKLEFALRDASEPFTRSFDMIIGRAILHHLDYRSVLRRLHDETLRPGGAMIFMEPLGEHPLIRLFTRLVPRAHTHDERSFDRGDLGWLRANFPALELYPFSLISLPAGIVSSRILPHADNAVLRMADRMDRSLARHAPWATPYFRQVILAIHKPISP